MLNCIPLRSIRGAGWPGSFNFRVIYFVAPDYFSSLPLVLTQSVNSLLINNTRFPDL